MSAKLIKNMPFADYFAAPGVNATFLKDVLKTSPWAAHERKLAELCTDTPQRVLFRCVHAAILEGVKSLPELGIALCPYRRDDRAANYIAWKAAFPNVIAMSESEHKKLVAITEAAEAQQAKRWLGKGDGEVTILYHDTEFDLDCKARPDWLGVRDSGPWLGDVKNTGELHDRALVTQCSKLGYYLQMAHYFEAMAAADMAPVTTEILWIGGAWPHELRPVPLTPDALAYGRKLRREAMRRVADAMMSGIWPTMAELEPGACLDAPEWTKDQEGRLSDLGLTDIEEE